MVFPKKEQDGSDTAGDISASNGHDDGVPMAILLVLLVAPHHFWGKPPFGGFAEALFFFRRQFGLQQRPQFFEAVPFLGRQNDRKPAFYRRMEVHLAQVHRPAPYFPQNLPI